MPPQLVLILLVVNWIGQIACQSDIVFPVDANDAESCNLTSGGTGQCLQISKCGAAYSEMRNICGYIGDMPNICCDVVRRQCQDIRPTMKRLANHLVGNVEEADPGEFPFMALITFKSDGGDDASLARCGAALVSKRFLLTAAHCIASRTGLKPYSVTLGTTDANDSLADSYLIDDFFVHEKHNRRQNDIGIVKLKQEVMPNDNIKPICIYTKPEDLPESVNLTVMGWGITNNEELSSVLLKGIVNPVPRTTCQARFNVLPQRIQLRDTHMCALGDKNINGMATDTCQGDSGGPIVLKENDNNYLVGLVSTGSGCGGEHFAGIYTIVHKFLPWIIEKGVFNDF